MNDNTKGAWIIHHTKKLLQIQTPNPFDEIQVAGKCGLLLSSMAASNDESILDYEKVKVIAKSTGLTILELNSVLEKLESASLIDVSSKRDVAILGLTSSSILGHTSNLFEKSNPSSIEKAAIDIAEKTSSNPLEDKNLKEYIKDSFKLNTDSASDLLDISEDIGFIDSERIDASDQKLFFNGNLFKRDSIQKTQKVLSSLSTDDAKKVNEVDQILQSKGVMGLEDVVKILGGPLLSKLQSVGMYDLNEVANNNESKTFVTKPAAFNKFGNPFEDDAMDLAKAFVASLAYGMKYSVHSRGKIALLKDLMRKLISGREVGPATAIGEDYKVLEHKRVVELRYAYDGRYFMKLLKRDIGQLALHVLEFGSTTSDEAILSSGNVTKYVHPEAKREQMRKKKQTRESKIQIIEALRTLRINP
jgi:hypothetical protein